MLSLSVTALGATVAPILAAASPELVACVSDQGPIISISPGDGGSVHPGGTVFVDNWTDDPAALKIVLEDGTVLFTATIPPQSVCDWQVPNLPILLGHRLTVTASAGATSATANIKIN